MRRHGPGDVVRVERPVRHSVDELDDVAVLDGVEGLVDGEVLPLGPLHDPPVVDVLVAVAGDLLLVRRAAAVVVPESKGKEWGLSLIFQRDKV